jgi:hypothetical protein
LQATANGLRSAELERVEPLAVVARAFFTPVFRSTAHDLDSAVSAPLLGSKPAAFTQAEDVV